MKDEIVTLKTALLAKEKGYPQTCYDTMIYSEMVEHTLYDPYTGDDFVVEGKGVRVINNRWLDKYEKEICAAPTQTELRRWLREEYNKDMHVEMGFKDGKKIYIALIYCDDCIKESATEDDLFDTYEEAEDDGLISMLNEL